MPLTVSDRARSIATFRFIEVRLMEITAAWTPLTPEMEVKIVLGRHIWDFAQHADALGKRTFELRQPEHYTLPPTASYAKFLEEIFTADGTAARLSALYDVFLPAMKRRYRDYIRDTDSLLDAPSVVVIERILGDITRMRDQATKLRNDLSIKSIRFDALVGQERAHANIVERGSA